MIIERSYNADEIKRVITAPGIWEHVSPEGEDMQTLQIPFGDNIYIMGYYEGEPVGLFMMHPTSIRLWQCHVHIMPEFRKSHGEEFGRRVIEWVWNNTEINKLIALIPECYDNVKSFAELQGFEVEGFIKNSHMKGGKLMARWLMSVERCK